MKQILSASVCLLFFYATQAQTLTDEDRKYVVGLLEDNAKRFLTDIEQMSDGQWNFKPSSDVWSVSEVSEHIALSEGLLFSIVQKILLAPADDEKAQTLNGKENQLLLAVMDRSSKAQAPEVIRPTGKFATKASLIEAFKKARDQTIEYVKTTRDPLKNHVARHPAFGELTTFQWLVFIAGHANRHVAQLEEVKTNINFPKI